MAKKTVGITKEYLESKLKDLEIQRTKVEDRIEQYTQMWQKLSGAIDLTVGMIKDITPEPNEDNRVVEEK